MRKLGFQNNFMMNLRFSLVMALLIMTTGCEFLGHMDELNMLGDYSRDKDNQSKAIKLINENYDALVKAITANEMSYFKNQSDISGRFGEPISIKQINVNGKTQQQWLYRQAILKGAKDKVYLYFDDQGSLLKYEQEQIQW
jgi:uncharacterized membrane protein YfhO